VRTDNLLICPKQPKRNPVGLGQTPKLQSPEDGFVKVSCVLTELSWTFTKFTALQACSSFVPCLNRGMRLFRQGWDVCCRWRMLTGWKGKKRGLRGLNRLCCHRKFLSNPCLSSRAQNNLRKVHHVDCNLAKSRLELGVTKGILGAGRFCLANPPWRVLGDFSRHPPVPPYQKPRSDKRGSILDPASDG
jgi:hypothetical protein